jgi:hypothetical protein
MHAELGARHSFTEAGRLLLTLLPCSPPNHTSLRNRLHRVSAMIEAVTPPLPAATPRRRRRMRAEIAVMIDGAHLRAVPGPNSGHVDVTVGKVDQCWSDTWISRAIEAPFGGIDAAAVSLRATRGEMGGSSGSSGASACSVARGRRALNDYL